MIGRNMFSMLKKQKYKVTKVNGTTFEMQAGNTNGGKQIYVVQADISPNAIEYDDIIETTNSNGVHETFKVIDPGYYDVGHFPAHYQIKVERISNNTSYQSKYTNPIAPTIINSGNGNIVFNNASPNSTITINQTSQFDEIKKAISSNSDIENKDVLLKLLSELQTLTNDKKNFAQKYNEFINALANHITVVTPFLPYLANFLPH